MFSRFVSIDLETTGLDPENCQIIELGAVIDDWLEPLSDQPTFHCYVKRRDFKGEPYALSMHSEIFKRIATEEDVYNYLYPGEVGPEFLTWIERNDGAQWNSEEGRYDRFNAAGKNFASFDDRFLRKLPNFLTCFRYRHRIIDPAMMYWNPLKDEKLPDSKTCMERAGLDGEVAHTALEDAQMVARLIQIGVAR